MSLVTPGTPAPGALGESQLPRTDVEIGRVYDPVLREALISFETSLSPVSPITRNLGLPTASSSWPLASVVFALSTDPQHAFARQTAAEWVVVRNRPASRASTAVDIVVDAVAELQRALGFTQQEVLQAAGIKKRTFQNWRKGKAGGFRPASVGRLWELHAAVTDLRELTGPTGVLLWIARDHTRKKTLLKGDFDSLIIMASRSDAPAWSPPDLLGAAEVEEKLQISVKPLRGFAAGKDRTVESPE
ncbi:hypothetical protein [Streptomyces sp. NPDC004579]|uniref:hypothetical protein n=1 Tax=Streptomyces sp. NPDC004579 TaxID=3154667 RepID=UPI0033AAC9CE